MFNYAVSVPYRKVRANEEVLLAWEMNGKPLPKIHGFPLRAVVTGYIGARSTKWLYKINAIAEPSLAPVQAQEYLYFTQQVRRFERLPSTANAIESIVVVRLASRTPSIPMDSLSRICPSRTWLPLLTGSHVLKHVGCRSAIIFPTDKQVVIHEGKIALQGWSYSGGGNWVERVEVSNDGWVLLLCIADAGG